MIYKEEEEEVAAEEGGFSPSFEKCGGLSSNN